MIARIVLIFILFSLSAVLRAQEEEKKKMPKIELEHYVDFYDQEHEKKYSEGDMLYGKKHGVWTYYYRNGQKQEQSEYTNGNLSGSVLYWFDNGQRQSLGYFKLLFQNMLTYFWSIYNINKTNLSNYLYKNREELCPLR